MKQQELISVVIRIIKLSETKGFFCFSLNKRSPEENWVVLHMLFLENEAQINQYIYGIMCFMSKQVSLSKLSSILQKMKISQRTTVILPFCTKAFNWKTKWTTCTLVTLHTCTCNTSLGKFANALCKYCLWLGILKCMF